MDIEEKLCATCAHFKKSALKYPCLYCYDKCHWERPKASELIEKIEELFKQLKESL